MKEIESERSLCPGRQLVPIIKIRQSLVIVSQYIIEGISMTKAETQSERV